MKGLSLTSRKSIPTKGEIASRPFQPKLGYSIAEAANALGLSYPSTYRLLKRGKLRSIQVLRTHIIPHESLEKLLKG